MVWLFGFVVGREVVRFVYVFCFLGCGRVVLFVVGGVVSMIVFSCGVSDFFVVVSVVCCGVWSFVLCVFDDVMSVICCWISFWF